MTTAGGSLVVTALSNESYDLYGALNTPSRFRNKLQLGLDPSVDYEVALISVSYVKSTYNFPALPVATAATDTRLVATRDFPRPLSRKRRKVADDDTSNALPDDEEQENGTEKEEEEEATSDDVKEAPPESPYWIEYDSATAGAEATRSPNRLELSPGYYKKEGFTAFLEDRRGPTDYDDTPEEEDSEEEEEEEEGDAQGRLWGSVALSFDERLHKFRVRFVATRLARHFPQQAKRHKSAVRTRVTLSGPLAYRLGFGHGDQARPVVLLWDNYPETREHVSTEPVQNFDVPDHFFLQSSLVKPRHQMGNGRYPVLGIVPVARDVGFGERATHTVEKKTWLPLEPQGQDSAEFLFNTQRAGIMSLAFGVSWVTLEIRARLAPTSAAPTR